jgi:hypothetical protein
MTRVDAIRELKIALVNDDERRFIAILEEFRATTAIMLYLSVVERWEGIADLPDKARKWIVKRVGGKTANKLENPFPIIKDVP